MTRLRFCVYQYQHVPLKELQRRWRDAERLGFDVVWNCDTVVEPDRARHPMFDGPTTRNRPPFGGVLPTADTVVVRRILHRYGEPLPRGRH